MLSNPELQYDLARRRHREAESRARLAYELRSAGMVTGARAASAALLRWVADRVDSEPLSAARARESYRPSASP